MNISPLRYPGGKNKLSPFIAKVCQENRLTDHYIEPYCGGAAVGLFLLFNGFVDRITLNDKDRSIFSFWNSILNDTDEFVERIRNTQVSLEEWDIQREYQKNKEDANLLDLGFSSFFMNRTNRSGILMGGMIGGRNQEGTFKIDCRFNKEELIGRIIAISKKRERIQVTNEDAIDIIDRYEETPHESTLIYLDPPYFKKADSLYLNHYKLPDHQKVCKSILSSKFTNWLVSYDNVAEIRALYKEVSSIEYTFKHTAHSTREGKEILFLSPSLRKEDFSLINPTQFKFVKLKSGSKIKYREK